MEFLRVITWLCQQKNHRSLVSILSLHFCPFMNKKYFRNHVLTKHEGDACNFLLFFLFLNIDFLPSLLTNIDLTPSFIFVKVSYLLMWPGLNKWPFYDEVYNLTTSPLLWNYRSEEQNLCCQLSEQSAFIFLFKYLKINSKNVNQIMPQFKHHGFGCTLWTAQE